MKKLTILIDMDDTLEDLLIPWVETINEMYGTDVKYEDIKSWDVDAHFPQLSKSQVHAPLRTPEFWSRVKPKVGAVEAVKGFLDAGHDIYVVTASHFVSLDAKMNNVLFKYFPYLNRKNVIVTHHKQMVKGDILIDDAPHNLIGGDYVKVLMDAPHNQWFDCEKEGVVRVQDWESIKALVYFLAHQDELEAFVSEHCLQYDLDELLTLMCMNIAYENL